MDTPTRTKKNYATPTLVVLGDVREVTKSTAGPRVNTDSRFENNQNKTR